MKQIHTLREEIVPLSNKQSLVLFVIIACIFQFVLFYAPVLADSAVKEAQAQAELLENEIIVPQNNDLIDNLITEEEFIANEVVIRYEEIDPQINLSSIYYGPETEPLMIYRGDTRGFQQALPDVPVVTKILRVSTHAMTAYNSDPRQTDDTPCITANGFDVCEHGIEDTIAANFLKFGTKVMIPELFGDRIFIVRDRMNKRFPNRVDIWMKEYNDAKQFGVKTAKIYVIE